VTLLAPRSSVIQADASDRLGRLVVGVVIAVVSLLVLAIMRPDKILLANTPSGGDMGAHVLIPAYLRNVLLPSGHLLGWSNDWYAGFPMLYFYFPLPAFVIVLLDVLLPYGVAFKLVTVAGLVALPSASYYFARSMGFSRPVALVGGIAGSTFMVMETYSIFGANTLSTLAGEYSFSWSFALSLFYLGMLIRNTRLGRGFTVGPAILLALTALSHIVTTLVVVVASLPLLLRRKGPSAVVGAWGVGFALAAFWAVPFLARVGYSTDMGWHPVACDWPVWTRCDAVFPRDVWPVLVLGLAGLFWAIGRRVLVGPAVTLILFPVVGFLLIRRYDLTKLYNARLLPYWYFALYLFAGLFVGMALVEMVRRLRFRPGNVWAAAVAGAMAFVMIAGLGVFKTPAWAAWNYTGYEGKPAYPEYIALMRVVDTLPPGRIMWEANNDMNKYGTPMALMLLPYWSAGHPSMEGLLFESSLTTPFHFLNAAEVSLRPSNPVGGLRYHGMDFARAVPHLALYDVTYYISYTEEAAAAASDEGLQVVAESPPFKVFALPETSLVDIATYQPAVWAGEEDFRDAALDWYDDIARLDRWLVEDGPADWPRVSVLGSEDIRQPIVVSGEVSDIVLEPERISFHTTAVGVPHMVKVSYFPNWQATGAIGPFWAAPSTMVVIPTQEDVTIEFRNTWAENLGLLLSGASLAGILGWLGYRRLRRRRAV
jgi:hypothetical protein